MQALADRSFADHETALTLPATTSRAALMQQLQASDGRNPARIAEAFRAVQAEIATRLDTASLDAATRAELTRLHESLARRITDLDASAAFFANLKETP